MSATRPKPRLWSGVSVRRSFSAPLSILGLLLVCLPSQPAKADPFSVSTRTVEIPEVGPAVYTVLTTRRSEISFLPPRGCRTAIDPKSGTVSFTASDYSSRISLQVQESGGDATPVLNGEALRQTVLDELKEAKVKPQFPCYTSGGAGVAFDCDYTASDRIPGSARLAFVAIPGGIARFTLTSPQKQFAKRQIDFSQLLNSFRVEPITAKPSTP